MNRRGLRDGWRLAVGTLTALPVAPPTHVDRDAMRVAMLLAPIAVAPLGLVLAAVLWAGGELALSPLAGSAVAVGLLALGSRGLHLDGLADTVDGLAASYDRERALAVMKTGDVGPAGAAAVVLVLLVQVAALAWVPPVLAGVLVCVSRSALLITCGRAIPAARAEGLGAPAAGTISPLNAVLLGGLWGAIATAVAIACGVDWLRLVAAFAAAMFVVALLVRRCVKRLGGVTGDVYGASIEVALATMLLVLS